MGLLGCSTRDALSRFTRAFTTLFADELSFDGKGLSTGGEVQVVVQLGSGPDLSGFDSSMVRERMLNEVR
jgi:hypothetical protein